MAYFTPDEHTTLKKLPLLDEETQPVLHPLQDKIAHLQEAIQAGLRMSHVELTPYDALVGQTVGSNSPVAAFTLPYSRDVVHAQQIERSMGRDVLPNAIDIRCHPVIEIRLTPDAYVVELLVSPLAWWDQQNLMGKLTITRHRKTLYNLLRGLPEPYKQGFWQGEHLSEMHLRSEQFQHDPIMDDWLSTFEPRQDWFRLGVWYAPNAEVITEDHIITETMKQIKTLYEFYRYIIWTGNNNYRTFYTRRHP